MYITENLSTPIKEECQVLVCGGGFGGIAAALSAARMGAKVMLLEKEYMLGGLGTAGLVTIYLPLCDGMGHQISFGLAEELLRLSIELGNEGRNPLPWLNHEGGHDETTPRYEADFNAQLFAIKAEQLLLKEGVEILYGTYAVAVHKNEDKIDAVMVENKSGRFGIKVSSVVDATGDCDIAHFAGVSTDTFKQGNLLAAWYYRYCEELGFGLKMMGVCDVPEREKTDENKVRPLLNRRFLGLDGREISELVELSHASILNDVLKQREIYGENYVPATIATIPQLRMTRKIVGEYSLDDREDHKYFEDSIGMVSDWRKRGPAYEVPFRTLYSKACPNLITAGRCTSVTEPMWDIMRVIPCCAVTGEAAGAAAAMSDDFPNLDIGKLQKVLEEKGVVLHLKDIDL